MKRCRSHGLFLLSLLGSLLYSGCATWTQTGSEPVATKPTPAFGSQLHSKDVAGVETILVRLDNMQVSRLPELWAQIDEQTLKPDLRIALDKNGIRAGKISGTMPPLLEDWIRKTVQRVDEDPMEQTGFAADISSYSQLWRCRANSRKDLFIRKFPSGPVCVFYNDLTPKGHFYDAPHFLYAIHAAPNGDSSASIKLTPEVQHGDFVKQVITRDAAIRTDTRRQSIAWDRLTIDVKIQRGECIVIGPTNDSRGLGEHFFHTKTQNGEIQPVLLLVRLSETSADDAFAPTHTDLAHVSHR